MGQKTNSAPYMLCLRLIFFCVVRFQVTITIFSSYPEMMNALLKVTL